MTWYWCQTTGGQVYLVASSGTTTGDTQWLLWAQKQSPTITVI